jgi:DNA repair and recombination RAD54-like protein
VCDEAHRLKNAQTLTYIALAKLKCKRRILLSGTPMQNDLGEFFSMVDFTNPGVLGDARTFNKKFQGPILAGREPDATDSEIIQGEKCAEQLSLLVNQFILRRTNTLLSHHLPPKVINIVCCSLTPLQKQLYSHLLHSSQVVQNLVNHNKSSVQVLPLIMALKSLCNHPKLLWDMRKNGSNNSNNNNNNNNSNSRRSIGGYGNNSHNNNNSNNSNNIFAGLQHVFPPNFEETAYDPRHSGKFTSLDMLLRAVRLHTVDDKFVIVSNYTSTLDLFVALCKFRGWNYVRLDGSTSVKKRQLLVDQLKDPKQDIFVFLLSSKAGGCGLNLIGANRFEQMT